MNDLKPCIYCGNQSITAFVQQRSSSDECEYGIRCNDLWCGGKMNSTDAITLVAPNQKEAERRLKTVVMLWNAPRTQEEMDTFTQMFKSAAEEEE